MIKTRPQEIWAEYQKIAEYLYENNVYEIVKKNEDFFEGKQWGNVKLEGMPQPVINVLQRVVKYFIATLGSNDIAISINPFTTNPEDAEKLSVIPNEVEEVIEQARIKEASKVVIRNSAVDGAGYMLQSFNIDLDSGQTAQGRIDNNVIDNTNVYFGNPYSNDIQSQPYIIIALRQHISQVKDEAERLGLPKEEIDGIMPDNEQIYANDNSQTLVTVLLKFWKERKTITEEIPITDPVTGETSVKRANREIQTVHFCKTTAKVTLVEPTDLEYRRYPISCFGWDIKKNSYLYTSPLTAVIPNQVFVNKCYAIAMQYGMQSAFPKIIYDKNKADIQQLLNSTQPHAVATMDIMGRFVDAIKIPDFSSQIISLIQDIIQQTKECMGVNDASLGNVKPDNTSAIIALQEASNVPLEIQRQSFYNFWEDTVRNILDIMSVTYGTRLAMADNNELAMVDFNILQQVKYRLNIDIGTGAQFSEIAQVQTLDKLFQNQVLNASTYIDAIPNKYIPSKQKLLKFAQDREEAQEQMAQAQMNQPL